MTSDARPWDRRRVEAIQFVALAGLLGVVASLAPMPWYETDRGTYLTIGRHWVLPDCSDLHCYRVLVAWVLESLPGPSLFKWKAYAVLCNAGAAIALMRLCGTFGMSRRAATYAAWLAAFGFGSLFTLFDPHTSDPLMFLLGPLLLDLLLRHRFAMATVIAVAGVFGKEFAAAPLWIYAIYAFLARQWDRFPRALLSAMTTTLVWIVFRLWLTLKYNYTDSGSASADLLGGGYLRVWASYMSPRGAVSFVFAQFGALFVLIPAGLWWAGRQLRQLSIAAIPALLALVYVQQPDRALWNFHFLAIPLSVLVLEALPAALAWIFVFAYGLANLRFGAQLTFVPSARFPVVISLLLAGAAIGMQVLRRPAGASRSAATLAS